ncbi:hypothetical protein IQ03_02925 [Gemmobacter caeni]|uniref:Uncharacterized protein n=1 Tax=Gemmobacter caeni TaxID=589035 RepID=A0A2T6AUZ5_9RHOB|nr:hypothetical protein [Gemmobacter caeni]PTX47615.1 hypothetical protein C8N34_112104 [Gemmobacter caeni]TWI97806.1 hypothetical protein IQ03_02925 [Gemmobacter caeni]
MSLLAFLADILFVGHSLVGPNLPPLVEDGLRATGVEEVRVEAQIINGAPLKYQWDHAAEAEGANGRARLETGQIGTLILTEAIPLAGQAEWNDSAGQVKNWAGLAWAQNPETAVYVYETWHSLASGSGAVIADDPAAGVPWLDRIAADRAAWLDLAAAAEAIRPDTAPPVRLIPAGQAMALAAGAAQAGALPGVADIRDLFADDIHPNGKGQYLVAMVHLAMLTGESPEGLPAKLGRRWQSRDAVISPELAVAMQRIAWAAAQPELAREPAPRAVAVPEPAVDAPAGADAKPVATEVAAADPMPAADAASFTPVTNPALALGLAGVNDWSVQQPFLDVMKTARPWTGHLAGQWGGMDHDALAAGGWLNANGWPVALPPGITGISTLVLTDLPEDAGGVAGRYLVHWQGQGDLTVEGRAQNLTPLPGGGLAFDYTPGEGAVLLTLTRTERDDPLRRITLVREDRAAAFASGQIFNPDWLDRIRGVRAIRFMDWMATNDSMLSTVEVSPKPDDYTWARNGVPVEVMVALANELDADPWFTLPHLAGDPLVRFYAESVADLLEPGRVAWVEYSNEVWNPQFAQGQWAREQAKARWGDEGAGLQFYGLRAAEVMGIWSAAFGDEAAKRLVRVVATQTGVPGAERAILDAPLAVAEGKPAPKGSFDAYAVTGYFAALLGSEAKQAMVKGWLAESAKADPQHPYAQAIARAAEELRDGRHSGVTEDTLDDLLTRVLPHHAEVAKAEGLRLAMYEGGSHVVGYGPVTEDSELTAFFQALNYAPEMGALYAVLLKGWAGLTYAPFNAFVDVYRPTKWGSWGALRHLGDENPRWRVLAKGCDGC